MCEPKISFCTATFSQSKARGEVHTYWCLGLGREVTNIGCKFGLSHQAALACVQVPDEKVPVARLLLHGCLLLQLLLTFFFFGGGGGLSLGSWDSNDQQFWNLELHSFWNNLTSRAKKQKHTQRAIILERRGLILGAIAKDIAPTLAADFRPGIKISALRQADVSKLRKTALRRRR